MKKLTEKDRETIKQRILDNKDRADIMKEFGIGKSWLSKIAGQLKIELEAKDPTGEAWLIHYKDQAIVDNPKDSKNLPDPPVLAAIGFIIKESQDAIYLKQIWSQTTGEHVRYSIILKNTILPGGKKPYRLVK